MTSPTVNKKQTLIVLLLAGSLVILVVAGLCLSIIFATCAWIRTAEANKWNALNIAYYNSRVWEDTQFLGVPMWQNPCDNHQMQELLFSLKPDVIIEAGTYAGGSALYYATIMDQIKPKCKIFTIDIDPKIRSASQFRVWKDHVVSYKGSSTDLAIVEKIKKQISPDSVVLVTLDSDHRRNHVYKELKIYSQLVTPGSYLVLQDTNINGHPVLPQFGPGPMEALNDFLKENPNYKSDLSKERLMLTFYPYGWLKREQ